MHVSNEGHRGYRFGAFMLDLDRSAVFRHGAEINLRPKSFEVLRHLAAQAGTLVTRDELLAAVWPHVVVTDDSLTQCLIDIRKALGDENKEMIRTIPRRGFIFELPVEQVPESGQESNKRGRKVSAFMLALASLAVLVGIWAWVKSTPTPEPVAVPASTAYLPTDPSIAVMDFKDLSATHDERWFAEGLSDEIRILLATIPGLKVIGRRSSALSQHQDKDSLAIGRDLQVRHLLEGTVQHSGDSVRISVQLIDTQDGTMLWSDSFSQPMAEVFELQEEVAASVLDKLKVHIGSYPVRGRPTGNPEAYSLFLKARLEMNVQNGIAAEDALERAVAIDPNFGEAWELLAHTYWTEPGQGRSREESVSRIQRAAQKALEVDPNREFARALLFEGHSGESSYADSITALTHALKQQPGNPAILRTLSWKLLLAGYFGEALRLTEHWVNVDPLSSIAHVRHAAALMANNRHSDAQTAFSTALRLGESLSWYIGENHMLVGEDEMALTRFREGLAELGMTDLEWFTELYLGARNSDDPSDYLDHNIPISIHALPAEYAEFILQALNRWHLLLGGLDRYFELIMESGGDDLLYTDAEYYTLYGVVYRNTGFTADPRFLEVARLLRLPAAWDTLGAPDFCSKTEQGWRCH